MAAYSEQVGADNIVYRAKISRWSYAVPIAIVIVGLLTMLVIGSIPITPKTIGSGGSVVEYYTICESLTLCEFLGHLFCFSFKI